LAPNGSPKDSQGFRKRGTFGRLVLNNGMQELFLLFQDWSLIIGRLQMICPDGTLMMELRIDNPNNLQSKYE